MEKQSFSRYIRKKCPFEKERRMEEETNTVKKPSVFFNYLLTSSNSHSTYNGYTNCVQRRIRQHNGEITGGAKATRNKGPWFFMAVIYSPQYTKHTAMSLEWHIRYPTNKKPRPKEFAGPAGRIRALPMSLAHDKFSDHTFTIYIHPSYYDMFKMLLESYPALQGRVVLVDQVDACGIPQ
jgi:predicted GIY-YIG superfamily endonuclease